jgi:hypothetical protein
MDAEMAEVEPLDGTSSNQLHAASHALSHSRSGASEGFSSILQVDRDGEARHLEMICTFLRALFYERM